MIQNHMTIDMRQSTLSGSTNVFPYNVEKGLAQATSISIQNINLSGAYYNAIPCWYNRTNKRLYLANMPDHYWAVNGNSLNYT